MDVITILENLLQTKIKKRGVKSYEQFFNVNRIGTCRP